MVWTASGYARGSATIAEIEGESKGSATYRSRGRPYALGTFYMSPDEEVDVLRGTIRDTRKAHGSILLRGK